jgi:acyl-CoA synthetase (NDP forming)
VRIEDVCPHEARRCLNSGGRSSGGWLGADTTARFVEAYGIGAACLELARTWDEAVALGRKLGFPVELKFPSPDLPHKSDVCGVLLDVPGPPA